MEDVACPVPARWAVLANTMAMVRKSSASARWAWRIFQRWTTTKTGLRWTRRLILKMIERIFAPASWSRCSHCKRGGMHRGGGGSTNGVLHTLAFAREAGIPFTIDDIEQISKTTPLICTRLTGPSAPSTCTARAMRLLVQRLIEGGYVDGSAPTCKHRWAKKLPAQRNAGQVIRPLSARSTRTAGCILKGNLATSGSVVKLKGTEPQVFRAWRGYSTAKKTHTRR